MKKIVWMLLALCLLAGSLSSCAREIRYDYDLSEYIDVGEYDPVRAVFADPAVCTEEEIDNALFQVMLTYGEFEPKEGTAERYNKVQLVYDLYHEGQVMEDYHEEEYNIIIGSDNFGDLDYLLGEAFIGASVGDTKQVEYTFPEDDMSLGFWAGITVTAKGTLTRIYGHNVPQCTDEFVQSFEEYDFQTVEDFRQHLAREIKSEKEVQKNAAVYRTFISQVTVKKYPQKELDEYIEAYQSDSKSMAEQLEISYEEYLKEYLMTDLESFEKAALEDARERVKEDMACIQVSRLMGLELTDEEYQTGLDELFENDSSGEEFESREEFEAFYTKEELASRLLWRKTFAEMVDRSVRVEAE